MERDWLTRVTTEHWVVIIHGKMKQNFTESIFLINTVLDAVSIIGNWLAEFVVFISEEPRCFQSRKREEKFTVKTVGTNR